MMNGMGRVNEGSEVREVRERASKIRRETNAKEKGQGDAGR